eukprot:SAG22_NODE_839_length_6905_cov_2.344696_2_plen_30_part_00
MATQLAVAAGGAAGSNNANMIVAMAGPGS